MTYTDFSNENEALTDDIMIKEMVQWCFLDDCQWILVAFV